MGQAQRERPDVDGVLSIAQAGAELGMGNSTAYDSVRAGRFPVRIVTIGGRRRVLRADLDRFLEGRAEVEGKG